MEIIPSEIIPVFGKHYKRVPGKEQLSLLNYPLQLRIFRETCRHPGILQSKQQREKLSSLLPGCILVTFQGSFNHPTMP